MDVITRTIVATEAIYSEISFSPDGDVIASPPAVCSVFPAN